MPCHVGPPRAKQRNGSEAERSATVMAEADPLMTLQWLHVRAKPNHGREIRPPAHCPSWDDARAEAQRRAVTSISHVVLVCRLGFDSGDWATSTRLAVILRITNSNLCRCIGRLGMTGRGERHGVLSMRGARGRCGVDRVIVRAPAAAFGDGDLRPGPMNIGPVSGLSSMGGGAGHPVRYMPPR
jgi:hypothetical protein